MNRQELERVRRENRKNIGKQNLINYNKSKKGKTYEQIYGEEKGKRLREDKIGKATWNKGLTGDDYKKHFVKRCGKPKGYPPKNPFKKGQHVSPLTEFKKGENIGSKHPRWLGGTIRYRGENWDEQSRKCMERDNFKCRQCSRIDHLGAHHLIPYRISKDNSLNNLITLCPKHHTHIDNEYRRIGFTHFLQKLIDDNKALEFWKETLNKKIDKGKEDKNVITVRI